MCSVTTMKPAVNLSYRWWIGVAMTANFLAFWAVPVAGMGQLWKLALQYPLEPLYRLMDENRTLRSFAGTYIYSKPKYADFFAISLLVTLSAFASLGYAYYYQMTHGKLDWWVIYAYNLVWVGLGGRSMGAAYTMAHKEGHNAMLYKKWLRSTVGNWFEDGLGVFYGSVPGNFTTSHVHIHHKLDGHRGDSFYQWDLDRSSWSDFMIYQHRVLMHMTGISSLRYFRHMGRDKMADKLQHGMTMYWLVYPACLLAATRSPSFIFWVYFQPLMCMTYFLAVVNYGLHAFIEFDDNGKQIECVNSSCIIEGDDDYFGEDDHMAHHYATSVYFKDLPAHQKTQIPVWRKYKASVFRKMSILELGLYTLFKDWDWLADHYVDYSEEPMPREELKAMLKARAQRTECKTEDYIRFLMERERQYKLNGKASKVKRAMAGDAEGKAQPAE